MNKSKRLPTKIVDLTLKIDGLILTNTLDEYIAEIEKISNTSYPILCEITYEEVIEK